MTAPKQLICFTCTIYVQSRCTSCISLNVEYFFTGSKLHTYQNITTKIAHDLLQYLVKESSIELHMPGQDGNFRKYAGSLAFPSSIITHITHKCHFTYEYITGEYKQPSFVIFQCVFSKITLTLSRCHVVQI